MPTAFEALKGHLAEIDDLSCAASVLAWDQQTYMPPGGGPHRAEQLSTLRRLVHARVTAPDTRARLDAAEASLNGQGEDDLERCLVRIVRRDVDRASRLPNDFVAAWARDRVLSNQVWREARPGNDFAAFRPHLEKMVVYCRRAAELYGYQEHPYDALLDGYEPGMTTANVRRIFAVLRPAQKAIAAAIATRREPRIDFLSRDYPEEAQGAFGLEAATGFGYDLRRGRLDIAPHPFASSFGRGDVRITTRYARGFLPQAIFAIFHEAGHALYEQNLSPELARTPLSHGCSNVFHESQSRLWENVVGRSRPFWQRNFPRLQACFPEQLADVSAEEFYRAVNRVAPSLIRVEADEVTYNLHIILRFELELLLVEGTLAVADLPGAWAAKMRELIGVEPPDDRDGVMQDTHWSTGSIGYFPTYALGNVMAAQIMQTARQARPALDAELAEGRCDTLRTWLVENLYRYGRQFLPSDLAMRVNGRPLEPGPFLAYLTGKFGELYGLSEEEKAGALGG